MIKLRRRIRVWIKQTSNDLKPIGIHGCALCSVDESPISTLLVMRGIDGGMFIGYCAPLDTLEVPAELAEPEVRQEILAQLSHLLDGAA